MSTMEARYQQRLDRYTTAMRNEQPDQVPIRPFVAEFTGVYAGYTCQEMAHDYENAFAKVENIRAMTDAAREYGGYARGHAAHSPRTDVSRIPRPDAEANSFVAMDRGSRPPGVCTPWDQAREQMPPIQGDEQLCQRIWQSVDALGYMYIWWIALAF